MRARSAPSLRREGGVGDKTYPTVNAAQSLITLGGTPTGCEARDHAKSLITLGGTPTGCRSRDLNQNWSAFTLRRRGKARYACPAVSDSSNGSTRSLANARRHLVSCSA